MPQKPDLVHLNVSSSLSGDDCRLLVESLVDYAIFMLDREGRVMTWNAGAETIKGYRASEIVGQHFSKFYPAEDIATGKPELALRTAVELGRFEDEGWRIRKSGERFWASVVMTALRDPAGNLRGFGKVTRDLSARRAAEQELYRAEQRFRQLVDSVTDYAIFSLDPSGHVSSWNPGARRLKGYLADEIIGKSFSVFYTPEDRAAGKPDRILEAVRREGRYEDESWRVRKDGTRFWANVVISALRDELGLLVGFAKVTRDLTDRRQAEEELRRSEERFRLMVDNVGDYAIYMLDPEGHVTTWNAGAERMKGYSAAEVLGRHFEQFFPDEARAEAKPSRELAMARAQGRFEDEGWRIRKDGTRFWANAILTALRDHKGELIGFAKITRDLTARREAEAIERSLLREQTARTVAEVAERRIRDSEERYRALSQRLEIILEGVVDGISAEDRSGRIVFANGAAAALCGFSSAQELVGASRAELNARCELLDSAGRALTDDDLPAHIALNGGGSGRATIRVRDRHTGRESWVLLRASAIPEPAGAPELAVNIWHDMTADRRREQRIEYLADASAALASSLETGEMIAAFARVLVPSVAERCAFYLLPQNGAARPASERAHALQRLSFDRSGRELAADDVDDERIWDVIRRGESRSIVEPVAPGAATQRAVVLIPMSARGRVLGVLGVQKNGSEPAYERSDVELLQELGERAGVALDNAQLYWAAQVAAASADEASRAKDEFLATVSHELRTPLSAIVGWSEVLRDRITDPNLAKPVEVIHRNAEAQVRIIDDILDVSRVITGKFRLESKPCELAQIVNQAFEVVRPSALAKKISLELSSQREPCLLVADPERMQQVIWNLLSNSVKFTPPGGSIRVTIAQDGSQSVLSVHDTGAGIDPEFLPHVFDRFRQADSATTRRVGGLGLGLALVRHIVELHGGRVAAESAGIGKGATFSIVLPIRAVAAPISEPATAPRESIPPAAPAASVLDGVKVLVVDDEADARELIATVLEAAGAVVQTAGAAAEGFDTFRRFRPDVLVSDVGMPERDGYWLIGRVRGLPAAEGGRTPALALTAFARESDRTLALSFGFTTHIGKPVSPGALTAAVVNLSHVNRSD